MNLVIINTETQSETADLLNKRLFAIKNQRAGGDSEELALVIDGKSLGFALEDECKGILLELAVMCKAVVCCEWRGREGEGEKRLRANGQAACRPYKRRWWSSWSRAARARRCWRLGMGRMMSA
jgi:hypothetical protein